MFKIIIVDDFHIERCQAESIIKDGGLPLEIIGSYDNASDALQAVEMETPDIILSDIQMPGMDGISFMRDVLRRRPRIKPVFFSFYDKFAYVKDAIDLNACAYILKPINQDEMISVLRNVISELEREKEAEQMSHAYVELLDQIRPLLKERFARAIFGAELPEQAIRKRSDYFNIDLMNAEYVVVVLDADLVQISDYQAGELISIEFESRLKEQSKHIPFIWCRDTYNRYQFLFYQKGISSDAVIQTMLRTLEVLEGKGIQYLAVVSATYNDLGQSASVCKQLSQLMAVGLKSDKSAIFFAEEMSPDFDDDADINAICNEICNMILNLRTDEVDDKVKRLMLLYQNPKSAGQLKNACLLLVSKLQLRFYDLDISFFDRSGSLRKIWSRVMRSTSIHEIQGLVSDLVSSAIEAVNEKRRAFVSRKIVDEVKQYIAENYEASVTVKGIATSLHYNPNYLNNLFKQVSGNTILEYLTQHRINVAKQLLKNTAVKQAEIAYRVGYKNEQYFKKLFQNNTGLTPKEYRIVSGGAVHNEG